MDNLTVYLPVLMFLILGVIATLGAYLAAYLLSPKEPHALKEIPYECGEEPVGSAWSAFNVRFYVVGLIFIIFDVETALMFPVAAVFRDFSNIGEGLPLIIIFLLFVSILIEGLVYCWSKGDLDWVRTFRKDPKLSKLTDNSSSAVTKSEANS